MTFKPSAAEAVLKVTFRNIPDPELVPVTDKNKIFSMIEDFMRLPQVENIEILG